MGTGVGAALLLGIATAATPQPAQADQLAAEQHEGERGYTAVEELSFEAIIEASDGYAATLKLRTALHNGSMSPRDAVLSLALPFASTVEDVSVAQGGQWSQGKATALATDAGRRDPGTVYVRELGPQTRTDVPGAEIVVFGVEPDATIQVEVLVRIHPRLRGDRWEIDLPSRGLRDPVLAPERRILVKGLRAKESFFVDDRASGNSPYMVTRPEDMVTVAWPAHIKTTGTLDGHFEVLPGPPGFDDGEVRLYLRLGKSQPARPDHVVVLIDHSRSTDGSMPADTLSMLTGLFDRLPEKATFEALAFNRTTTPLLQSDQPASVHDEDAMKALRGALAQAARGQGTDLAHALSEAGRRSRAVRARRPLVVVVTDGMLPARTTADDIGKAFEETAAKGARRPEVLFVIDDPILARKGIAWTHPVARVAARIGARISLESLAALGTDSGAELLAAPAVLGDLKIGLPDNAQLQDEVPRGLVAGSFTMLRGRYVGKPPRSVSLGGNLGSRRIGRRLGATELPRRPQALVAVASGGDLDVAATEGFTQPPWYHSRQEADARRGIMHSGRAGREVKGHLDERIFKYYLTTRVLPRARACYNRSLTRHTDQEGRVLLEMEVGKGEVMLARTAQSDLKHTDPELVDCMTEAAWSLDIPAGKLDDQVYRLRYPLSLIAPEEGKVSGRVERIPDEIMEVLLGR